MDVDAQMAAAYACDRAGDERLAATFYDAAWLLGVPAHARDEFVVGYGSTLRNVGRLDEAIALLSSRVREQPDDQAARCFLALALHDTGQHDAALGTMLDVALALHAASPALTRYRRALGEYRARLQAGSG
jgi:thioredoxin-like negative regulator of GroEL